MKPTALRLASLLLIGVASCAAPPANPNPTSAPTIALTTPSETPLPTEIALPTDTAAPSSPTPAPQPLLLRRSCGRDYVVRADEPTEIFYGGWGVKGLDLAQQWSTALTIDLTIDGAAVTGRLQPPAPELPYNCPKGFEDSYWIYYSTVLPGLAAGTHDVTVAFNALRALPDGYGSTFGPGEIAKQTFWITAQ